VSTTKEFISELGILL